jgi:hypothetical protein
MVGQTSIIEANKVKVVTHPHKGAALALQNRAKQLYNMVYAFKQHIHTLREASRISIKAHQAAHSHLELPSSLLVESSIIDKDAPSTNGLLANEGLRTLIDQLATCEEKTAECIQQLHDPETAHLQSIAQLNSELEEINAVLNKDRLGKAHHQKENNVCSKASELTENIRLLNSACINPYTADPYCDAYTLCNYANYRMKVYLDMEKDYAIQGLAEQKVEKRLEKNVFTIMQNVPVEHEKIVSPLMDKCNEILGSLEEKTKNFHALTDWTALESRNPEEFASMEAKYIKLDAENHPNEEHYNQFQIIRLENLEIYHKLRRRPKQSDDKVSVNFETKLRLARQKMTLAKHDYAIRGTWLVSLGGHLIEYDSNEHSLLSMFNLRKCTLELMEPDKFGIFGTFTLRGQKVHELSDKKKHRRKKNYKFRAPMENIKTLHEVLSAYCTITMKREIAEGKEDEILLDRVMTDETAVNIEAA